jgi:YHS domain-containing protein
MNASRSTRRGSFLFAASAVFLCFGAGASHAIDGVNTGYFGDVAILGYDPVAYFTEGRATRGSPDISERWLGATWQFASEEHRAAFMSEPVRYAPQYGGFCALGATVGEASANIDPEAWRIVGGKLYLFSGKEGLEEDFDAAPAAVVAKADAGWPTIEKMEFAARAAAGK